MSIHAVYEIQSATGIGVFAPQCSRRRGYFIGTDAAFDDCRNSNQDVAWGQEDNYNASTQNRSLPSGALSASNEMPWLATRRGRCGIAIRPYGMAGGIAGELRTNFAIPAGNTTTTVTHGTWTAGARVEHGLTDRPSARLEHLYHDTGCHRFSDDRDQQSAERQSRSSRTEPSLSCRTAGTLMNELTYQKGESS